MGSQVNKIRDLPLILAAVAITFIILLCYLENTHVHVDWMANDHLHDMMQRNYTIHLVPHSHDDAGWIKTIGQYYEDDVRKIYNSVLECLVSHPHRKFIIVEQIYFMRWFRDLSEDDASIFRKLLENDQIEFVMGGFVMNDEASVVDIAAIRQLSIGHQFLFQEFGISPQVGFQIDTFGHSAATPSIMARMGLKYVVLNRIHYALKESMKNNAIMEFAWSTDSTNDSVIAHVLDQHYSSPPDVDFEKDSPISSADDLKLRASNLIELWLKQKEFYTESNHLLQLLGDDFRWKNAQIQYDNWDIIIRYINEIYPGVTLKYSTLSEYFENVESSVSRMDPLKFHYCGDFFPYADRSDAYWTGYFSSKPWLKRKIRESANLQRVSEIVSVHNILSNPSNVSVKKIMKDLKLIDFKNSEVQHHDAITGTSKEMVSQSYLHDLDTADAIAWELLDSKRGDILADSRIIVYNSNLSSNLKTVVKIPAIFTSNNIGIYSSDTGERVPSQTIKVPNSKNFDMYFVAEFKNSKNGNVSRTYILKTEEHTSDTILVEESTLTHATFIQNSKIELILRSGFNNTLELGLTSKIDGSHASIFSVVERYKGYSGTGQKSGAYIMKTESNHTESLFRLSQLEKVETLSGNLFSEISLKFSNGYIQSFRIYNSDHVSDGKDEMLELYIAGNDSIPMDSEIIHRVQVVKSPLDTTCNFLTDSNGLAIMKRTEVINNENMNVGGTFMNI
jgi:hypothetical protein